MEFREFKEFSDDSLNSLYSLNSLQSDSDNRNKPPFFKGRFGGNVNMNGGVLHHHYIKSNKGLLLGDLCDYMK